MEIEVVVALLVALRLHLHVILLLLVAPHARHVELGPALRLQGMGDDLTPRAPGVRGVAEHEQHVVEVEPPPARFEILGRQRQVDDRPPRVPGQRRAEVAHHRLARRDLAVHEHRDLEQRLDSRHAARLGRGMGLAVAGGGLPRAPRDGEDRDPDPQRAPPALRDRGGRRSREQAPQPENPRRLERHPPRERVAEPGNADRRREQAEREDRERGGGRDPKRAWLARDGDPRHERPEPQRAGTGDGCEQQGQ